MLTLACSPELANAPHVIRIAEEAGYRLKECLFMTANTWAVLNEEAFAALEAWEKQQLEPYGGVFRPEDWIP